MYKIQPPGVLVIQSARLYRPSVKGMPRVQVQGDEEDWEGYTIGRLETNGSYTQEVDSSNLFAIGMAGIMHRSE